VKNTQQKSSATFLLFFDKSAKNSASVSSGRWDFYRDTFAFCGRTFGQLATLPAGAYIALGLSPSGGMKAAGGLKLISDI
jgi:hypothetical protein